MLEFNIDHLELQLFAFLDLYTMNIGLYSAIISIAKDIEIRRIIRKLALKKTEFIKQCCNC